MSPPITHHKILLLAYPAFDVLDLLGPTEVFLSSTLRHPNTTHTFEPTLASSEPITTTDNLFFQRNVPLGSLLAPDADTGKRPIEKFDVLIVPGAAPKDVKAVIEGSEGIVEAVKAFAELGGDGRERWLVSVCSGAGILGGAGVLAGRTVTTHWSYVEDLKKICESVRGGEDGEVEIVLKRFVDAGRTGSGVRVVTAGGISCGIDCGLWIASQMVGMEEAKKTARLLDHEWRFGSVHAVTEGWKA